MYTAFASVYDRLMREVDYPTWAAHYAYLLSTAGVKSGRVCECACGTGSLTLPLAAMGYTVTGVDLSNEMLGLASSKAKEAGLTIPFVRQDMTKLALHRRQNAILSTCDGVNYLLSSRQLLSFFSSAFKALLPGGVLLFDVSTPFKLSNTLGNNTLGLQDPDISYIWQNHYNARTHIVHMNISFFVRNAGASYDRFEEEQRQRAWTKEELTAALLDCGFEKIRFWGNTQRRAPKPEDERWHIRAIKPKEAL